jgi:hypothetical protein
MLFMKIGSVLVGFGYTQQCALSIGFGRKGDTCRHSVGYKMLKDNKNFLRIN